MARLYWQRLAGSVMPQLMEDVPPEGVTLKLLQLVAVTEMLVVLTLDAIAAKEFGALLEA